MWKFAVVGDGLRLLAVVYQESRRGGRNPFFAKASKDSRGAKGGKND